jgi:hypothetical protein
MCGIAHLSKICDIQEHTLKDPTPEGFQSLRVTHEIHRKRLQDRFQSNSDPLHHIDITLFISLASYTSQKNELYSIVTTRRRHTSHAHLRKHYLNAISCRTTHWLSSLSTTSPRIQPRPQNTPSITRQDTYHSLNTSTYSTKPPPYSLARHRPLSHPLSSRPSPTIPTLRRSPPVGELLDTLPHFIPKCWRTRI